MPIRPINTLATDYPAAHSMDTTWFALDKNGHVAAFESYEGGAVPNDALSDQTGEIDPSQAIAAHAPGSEVIYVLDDRRSPLSRESQHARPQKRYVRPAPSPNWWQRLAAVLNPTGQPSQAPRPSSQPTETPEEFIAPVVMFITDLHIVEQWLSQGLCRQLKSLQGTLVAFEKLPLDVYRSIHDRGACAGCYYVYGFGEEIDPSRQFSPAGMYHYVCCEDQMAVPYGLFTIPERPLDVECLPTELQDKLAKVHFHDVSFADTQYIQPAERAPSYTWDGGYLREDWKTFQANPGQEDDYAELYKAYADDEYMKGITFLPPNS